MFHWEGLIPLVGGVYGLLLVSGILPAQPGNPEKTAEWRARYGKPMLFICPFLIAFGIAQCLGVFA